jgi:hypothetical protein
MALRDLEKRLAVLEARAAGEQLDWGPLENCLRRIAGQPTLCRSRRNRARGWRALKTCWKPNGAGHWVGMVRDDVSPCRF